MKILDTIKESQYQVTRGIYIACAIIAVVMVVKVFAFVAAPDNLEEKIQAAEDKYKLDDKAVKEYQKKYVTAVDLLKKKNHLSPKASSPKPPTCTGVIGSKALINGKLYAVGDSVLGAKITDISPTGATIEWEGKPMQLAAFAKVNAPSSPSSGRDETRHRVEDKSDKMSKKAGGMPGPANQPRGPGGRGPMGMSDEQMQKMRQMRDKYMKMSPDEQQKFRDEQRQRFGGRGGGDRGGRGGGGR